VVDAHTLLHQTLEICRSDLHDHRMRLELDLSAPRSHVEADAARVQQVFWNLIKNAVKFSLPGATLAIRTRNEADPAGGQRLVVEMTDTGIGIEPEVLPRIFDAFAQGEDTLTRRFGGLGLGLTISRSLVEAHGGRLTAASLGRGRGTTFTLELRAADAPAHSDRTSATPAGPTPPRRGLRILLVEDDRTTLQVMLRLLRRQHEVKTAETLASALEVGTRQDYDLIISDISLPDGTGLELMRRLRARRPVKGIALSGLGTDEDLRRSREAGFVAHLTKPVDFPRLEALIQKVAAMAEGADLDLDGSEGVTGRLSS
jgi:CheY-like chemotaxis protein